MENAQSPVNNSDFGGDVHDKRIFEQPIVPAWGGCFRSPHPYEMRFSHVIVSAQSSIGTLTSSDAPAERATPSSAGNN
jgi:hypothetical protein